MSRRGLIVILALLGAAVVISVVAVTALYLLLGRGPSLPEHAMLRLEVGGELPEQPPSDVAAVLRGNPPLTVHAIVESLRRAKTDDRVAGVLLRPTGFTTPYWGKVQEIRDAVLEFRTSGKPVYAYLEYASERDYYLATAADKIFLMPASSLDLTGVATYQLFLRGTLDMIGVYPDLHRIGDYKSAVETFTEKGYTPAHKEMDTAINRSLYDQLVQGIAEGRRKPDADVRLLIDQGPYLPDAATRAGLVDEVGYENEAKEALRAATGAPEDPDRDPLHEDDEIDGRAYAGRGSSLLGLSSRPRIGVIYASGAITSGKSGFDPVNGPTVGSETLIEAIKLARKDDSLRALVLRIDSPGGSSVASDAIWHELTLAARADDRPLVASMSDLAASGGYYIAMAADTIVAQPSTLTGSIGIFGGKYVTGGLYNKLGAQIDSTSHGKRAEFESPVRRFTPDEVGKLDEQLRAFYDDFVAKVAQSRRKSVAEIEAVAQGRVWTGRQALDNGLVDGLGGLDRAVAIAKERVGIAADEEVELAVFPPHRPFYELLSELSGSGAWRQNGAGGWTSGRLNAAERDVLRALRGPFALFRRGEPLALMPYRYLSFAP